MERSLYFAYGSNMSIPRFKKRVPSARCEGTGFLYGHRLAFHKVGRKDGSGKCDALATGNPEDLLAGVLYSIDPDHRSLLHAVEGVGAGYEIMHVDITTPSGSTESAFTYYATNIKPGLKPFHWYKQHVLHGARQNNLPADYVDHILSIESIEDPDAARVLRELSVYNL
jgi:gamma-glutamylcyclotransferase